MNSNAKFALIWTSVLFILNTFIGPLIGINRNSKITWIDILAKLMIWSIAGFALYYIKQRQDKKQDKDEKMG